MARAAMQELAHPVACPSDVIKVKVATSHGQVCPLSSAGVGGVGEHISRHELPNYVFFHQLRASYSKSS